MTSRLRDRLRVLVVDDMSTSRGLLVRALETLGIDDVASASDGASALHLAQVQPPDLVLSDLIMPGLTGSTFWRACEPVTRPVRRVSFLSPGMLRRRPGRGGHERARMRS